MSTESTATPRRTPLFDCHRAAGAKLVDFAGWEMPVQYAGLMVEHHAVRRAAGLFDVSHMGEFRVDGPGALDFLQRLTPNNVAKLRPGRAHYSALLNERGTYLDDLLVYQLAEGSYLLVVNASNIATDLAWIKAQVHSDCEIEDVSDAWALLALQGPRAVDILTPLASVEVAPIRYYRFRQGAVCGVEGIISRTGYTGEDGFELYLPAARAAEVWDALVAAGKDYDLQPAGLGARDTLRLEAGMALYGHEIDDTTTPYDAALGWVVKLGKGPFIGREALVAQKEGGGPARALVGFEVQGRGIARQGDGVLVDGEAVGTVTSGTWSPTLEKAIGTTYVPMAHAAVGTALTLQVRRRQLVATVVPLPFYRRD